MARGSEDAADPVTDAREVIRGTIASSVALLTKQLPGARHGDAEGVHQSRVALRRLRSDLRTFEPLLDESWADDLRTRMKPLAATLGAVRDDDVHLRRVHELATRSGVGAAGVVDHLQHERDRHRADLLAMLDEIGRAHV